MAYSTFNSSKRLYLALFSLALPWIVAGNANAQSAPSVSLATSTVVAGTTTNLIFQGINTEFNDSTDISITCTNNPDNLPEDITFNDLTIISPTEMIASINVATDTRCLYQDGTDGQLRSFDIDIAERGPSNLGHYLSMNVINANLTVNKLSDGSAFFGTINDAIAQALPGDTILVGDGAYLEAGGVDLGVQSINLKSVNGPDHTSIESDVCVNGTNNYTIYFTNENISVEGFSLPGSKAYCDGTGVLDAVFRGMQIDGTADHAIKNMKFGSGLEIGLNINGSAGNMITDNLFEGNNYSIMLQNVSSTTASNNSFINNSQGIYDSSPVPNFSNDFSHNYWGDSSGPNSPTLNASASGDMANTGILFYDWCADQACLGIATVAITTNNINDWFKDQDVYGDNWFLRAPGNTGSPSDTDAGSTPSLTALQDISLVITSADSSSTIAIPRGTIITRDNGDLFDASMLTNTAIDIGSLSGLGKATAVGQAIQWGLPNLGLIFSRPITINLFIGSHEGQTLNIYHSNSTSSDWLSSSTCMVTAGYCNFTTEHASYFVATKTQTDDNRNDGGNGGGGGAGAVILILPPKTAGSSTDQVKINAEAGEKTPIIISEKPKVISTSTPKKKILGEKIYSDALLVRDITTKKIYVITGKNKHVIRTIKDLRRYRGVKIYDLPPSLLSQWKDI